MPRGRRSGRGPARRLLSAAAAALLTSGFLLGAPVAVAPLAWPAVAAPVQPAPVATPAPTSALPSGFVDETIVDGLLDPTIVAFAPDGRVFVAEKRGVVKTWPTLAGFERNDGPDVAIDIRDDVMNYWDRGLLGLAVDPDYPATPDLYLLYTYDALPGGTAPHWNDGDVNSDPCPSPPGSLTDGCVVTNRLDRVTIDPATGLSTGRFQVLVGWCQQFPSHSAGSVAFGPDGMLYVSGGDGASFNAGAQDYGQYGGTLPDPGSAVTPANPCADPPAADGGPMVAPTAEGGALRSQSFRRPAAEAAALNGSILRLDPATGAAAAGNPAIADPDPNRRRIVAYGLRNPYRMTFRPGTGELYVGDVGYSTWEEVDALTDPLAGPTNFGWPCHEGPETGTYFTSVAMDLCTSLDAGTVADPLYAYSQGGHMASGDGCPPVAPATSAGAAVAGLAFYEGTDYPAQYRGALFVADFARDCIVVLPPGGGGAPTGPAVPFSAAAEGPVMLATDPSGDLVYVAFSSGEIHRLRYLPPVASFVATPASGVSPLEVTFDGHGSRAPAGLTGYEWDFGDGSPHASGVSTTHTYPGGTWTARLTVTDANGVTATSGQTIAVSNTPPTVTLDQPTCTTGCWKVGDVITLAAHAADDEDGPLAPSAFSWNVDLVHCHSPGDCHAHDLLDPSGVASTSIVAPDHDAGSFLRVTVTATDSGGLTDTATIDVAPRSSSLRVVSSPIAAPVTLEGVTSDGSVGPTAGIVGHRAVIAAAPTWTSGEDRWAFSSWSDHGAISHAVAVGETPRTISATYARTATDASNTCAGAPIGGATAKWVNGRFGTATDVDWVRFKVAKAGRYRVVLGNLPVDGRLDLYAGCSTRIASIDHPGLHWEESVALLAPGTYAIRMSDVGGVAGATFYHWLIQPLAAGGALLSARPAPSAAGSLRLVGEVMNTSSTTRAVTITARLYSASGTLLKIVSTGAQIRAMGKYGRSFFTIQTTRPAGFASVRFSVSSAAASPPTRLLGTIGVVASAPSPGLWRVSGSIVNASSTTATHVSYLVGIFDSSGEVLNATSGPASRTILSPHQTAMFSVTFAGLAAPPMATSTRAKAS